MGNITVLDRVLLEGGRQLHPRAEQRVLYRRRLLSQRLPLGREERLSGAGVVFGVAQRFVLGKLLHLRSLVELSSDQRGPQRLLNSLLMHAEPRRRSRA